jgi:aryl-alcohol dehydrogenase-like predicted oxidoreductase
MQYRRFGKTELPLSVFSLGTMRSLASESTFRAVVEAALAAGINHLETARGYGQSERLLGRTLSKLQPSARTRLILTTKIPPPPTLPPLTNICGTLSIGCKPIALIALPFTALTHRNIWSGFRNPTAAWRRCGRLKKRDH